METRNSKNYQIEGYLYLSSVDTTMDHYSFAQNFLAAENPYAIYKSALI